MSQSDITIRFYYEVFETFRNLFYDDTITLSDNKRKCKAHPRALNLNPALTIENYKDNAYNTDGTVIRRIAGTEFVILNLEVKTDWETQQCSYLQNAAYYANKLTPTIPLDMTFYDGHTAIVAACAISTLIIYWKLKNLNYVERLRNKNLWLAEVEIDGSKQHVVVEFTFREVHDACHNNEIALKILYLKFPL
ncbi:11920_t:CDS:2 [Entrophospora sp. SA101]|nr:8580_t:CDS:2 [Entrophospora sp. SA101]CAJ0747636.1 3676_t:CDS:2 [Entrophospora sp. SA101]CAJ0747637.1 3677_t:CDS:2 [Entrophospora sp. SA101]CAJ0753470.1 15797_t:CDS:2 [Entrophospora sp. SA101]CAJ0755431.1 2616_t:CDS:2 [Entrophospora sp. SA101]